LIYYCIEDLISPYNTKSLTWFNGFDYPSYWAKQVRKIKPEEIKALAMVKSIYLESNSSAGARTISGIATARGFSLSRYVATRLMKEKT
jgi:hypothetical protein